MKKLKTVLQKVVLPTTKQETSVLCTTVVILGLAASFQLGQWHYIDNNSVNPTYDEVKAYTDGLAETHPAKLAVVCEGYIPKPEVIEIPMWMEPQCPTLECDCGPDYDLGHSDGMTEAWKISETIASEKGNPKEELFRARNLRGSKGNLPNYTQQK